jgi:hypothetical protein
VATFKPGQSGNPAGRPLGAVNKLTNEGRRIAGKEGPAIIKKIAASASSGDPHAQRLFMTFLYPRLRLIDAPAGLPPMATVEEAAQRIAAISAKMEASELGVDEGQALIQGAQAYVEARKASELEAEVQALRETVARLTAIVEQGGNK